MGFRAMLAACGKASTAGLHWRVLSLLALACWIGGLLLLTVSPALGACIAAGGFVAAGAALKRPGDLEALVGFLMLAAIVLVAASVIGPLFGYS